MSLYQTESLATAHTFGFTHRADRMHFISSESQLSKCIEQGLDSPLILGKGSNVIFTGDYHGDVLCNQLLGRALREEKHAYVLTFAGGESWHDCVAWTVNQGIGGLENLAMIPGTVGAAPVQNIGAYGVEFKDLCTAVDEFDLVTGLRQRRQASECQFNYRSSIYKYADPQKKMVVAVEMRLPKKWKPQLSYGPLQALDSESVTPKEVMDKVCEIRRSKLPDPYVLSNAGSFFKNPIVSGQLLEQIKQSYPDLPYYRAGVHQYKLAAGWLIEQCGGKEMAVGDISVHQDQALVLVNLGQGTSHQLLELAKAIQNRVQQSFGVSLEPEVHFYQGRKVWFPL